LGSRVGHIFIYYVFRLPLSLEKTGGVWVLRLLSLFLHHLLVEVVNLVKAFNISRVAQVGLLFSDFKRQVFRPFPSLRFGSCCPWCSRFIILADR